VTSDCHILFAGRSVFHFPYYESVCEALITEGAYVTFVFDAESSKGQSDTALKLFVSRHSDNCEVLFAPSTTGISSAILRTTRELRAYCHYLRRASGSSFYLNRQSRYLPSWIRWIARIRLLRFIFASDFLSTLLAFFERRIPANHATLSEVKRLNPKAIFAAPINMRFSREVEFIKAGNQLSVPTFGLVQTWDNLTTKGIFHVRPNHLYCWNDQHRAEAIAIHGFSPESTSIVGAPFYDKWFINNNAPPDRATTLSKLGLHSYERYIVYLGSSANIARDESWLVHRLLGAIQQSGLTGIRLVVRPHPVNKKWIEEFRLNDMVIIDSSSSLPEDVESIRQLAGVIVHSQFAVGVNTSAMIDAVILGKVCVALISSRYSKTQVEALHFAMLRATGALLECSADKVSDIVRLIENDPRPSSTTLVSQVLPLVRSQVSTDLAGQLITKHLLSTLSPN